MPVPTADAIDTFVKETAAEGGTPSLTRRSDGTATAEIRFPMGRPAAKVAPVTMGLNFSVLAQALGPEAAIGALENFMMEMDAKKSKDIKFPWDKGEIFRGTDNPGSKPAAD